MKKVVISLVLLVCMLSGCATIERNATTGNARSKVLTTAFADTLAEVVALMKKQKGKLSEDPGKPGFVLKQTEMMQQRFPALFRVSSEDEERFRNNRFADHENRKSVSRSIEQLSHLGVELPGMSIFLINKFRAGNLKGAKLELTARFLSCQIAEVEVKAKKK